MLRQLRNHLHRSASRFSINDSCPACAEFIFTSGGLDTGDSRPSSRSASGFCYNDFGRAHVTAGGDFETRNVQDLIQLLLTCTPDELESETVEFKGWCSDPRKLGEKIAEAASCLANAQGGLLIVGIGEDKEPLFSRCPHSGVDAAWIERRIREGTHPPVACRATDISAVVASITNTGGRNAVAVEISRSRFAGSHVTSAGLGKVRHGKECRPLFRAEDDYTALVHPRSLLSDISSTTIDRAAAQHGRRFEMPGAAEVDVASFLAEARVLPADQQPSDSGELTLAALLLFGTPQALERCAPYFETILIANGREDRFRKNICDSTAYLLGGTSPIRTSAPEINVTVLKELLVNAYVHRCYRMASPIIIENTGGWLAIKSPGSLPAGVTEHNLIHGMPVYRNLSLAGGARFVGLCDEIGKGFNIVVDAVLRGGFDFPVFENTADSFSVRIELQRENRFAEFVTRRSESLQTLDDVVVLRTLWAKSSATLEDLAIGLQRPAEYTRRVLQHAARKGMVEQVDLSGGVFSLSAAIRSDIENIFSSDQFNLFGEPVQPGFAKTEEGSTRSRVG